MEKKLYKAYQDARKRGLRLGRRWLKLTAKKLMLADHPGEAFRASTGWARNFVNRHGLSYRKKSNKKELSAKEREPRMQRWHARLQRMLKSVPEDAPAGTVLTDKGGRWEWHQR
jgi:hypothetical protein